MEILSPLPICVSVVDFESSYDIFFNSLKGRKTKKTHLRLIDFFSLGSKDLLAFSVYQVRIPSPLCLYCDIKSLNPV